MKKNRKFEALKQDLVNKNEAAYGAEARAKYGDAAVDAANAKLLNATELQFASAQDAEELLKQEVIAGVQEGGVDAGRAARITNLHAAWLKFYWPEGLYSPATHINLAEGYLADDRFRAYYDAWIPGAAEYLVAAIKQIL